MFSRTALKLMFSVVIFAPGLLVSNTKSFENSGYWFCSVEGVVSLMVELLDCLLVYWRDVTPIFYKVYHRILRNKLSTVLHVFAYHEQGLDGGISTFGEDM